MRMCNENKLVIRIKEEIHGELMYPREDSKYIICIQSCNMNYYHVLDTSNCFSVSLYALMNASYCTTLLEEEVSYYIVNDKEDNKACIQFNDIKEQDICIVVKKEEVLASIDVYKKHYDCCHQEIYEDYYDIQLKGMNSVKQIRLERCNGYHTHVESLEVGWYEIHERVNDNETLTYEIDGNSQETNKFYIDEHVNMVVSETRQQESTHCIRITRWNSEENKLSLPDNANSYEVRVFEGKAYKEYTLNCMNRFSVLLEFDKHQHIRVEMDDVKHYEVNGEVYQHVQLDVKEDYEIRVIGNNDNVVRPLHTMSIHRYIEEEGRLIVPSVEKVYEILVEGYQDEYITLDKSNGYSATLYGLDKGYYRIVDRNENSMLNYEINGVKENDGYIYVEKDVDIFMIETKEHVRASNCLNIQQRVGTISNNRKATMGVYEVSVNGEMYVLNVENNYSITMDMQSEEIMSVQSISNSKRFIYLLDGVTHEGGVNFTNKGSDYSLSIIEEVKKIKCEF